MFFLVFLSSKYNKGPGVDICGTTYVIGNISDLA